MPNFRHRIRYVLTIELYGGELVMTLTLYSLDLVALDDQDGYEADIGHVAVVSSRILEYV